MVEATHELFGSLYFSWKSLGCLLTCCNAHLVPIDVLVWDDLKLPYDSGEESISEWSGWQFDSYCEIFSLLDGKRVAR